MSRNMNPIGMWHLSYEPTKPMNDQYIKHILIVSMFDDDDDDDDDNDDDDDVNDIDSC